MAPNTPGEGDGGSSLRGCDAAGRSLGDRPAAGAEEVQQEGWSETEEKRARDGELGGANTKKTSVLDLPSSASFSSSPPPLLYYLPPFSSHRSSSSSSSSSLGCLGEADLLSPEVEDGVVSSHEHVSEDPKRSELLREVEAHEA
eukprot:760062-Hanusia_phi.AAC.2